MPDTRTRDLKTITAEMKALQDEYTGKNMPAEVGEKFEALAKEAEAIQQEQDRAKRIKAFEIAGKEIPDPILPAGKSEFVADPGIAGYLTLGEAVVTSPLYKQFVDANFPKGNFPLLVVEEFKNVRGTRTGYVPLTKAQRSAWEAKAVPTIGTGVLEPQRLADITQQVANDETVLRDVLNVARTTRDSVEYVRRDSLTRRSDVVAHGAAKPQGSVAYSLQTAQVRTIAVWIPVTVQMIADWPALRNLIDTDLLYDLRKTEELQVMYGGGTGQDFAGIVPNAGHDIAVADARVSSPTIVDQIRVGMTEVRVSSYSPNAVVLHPIDWEKVVLAKGSDAHYLAQVFPTSDGTMRVWGLRVVESVAAEDDAGMATEARNLVVGDFMRGATLWIREEANVQLGMQNDDFTKNLRTILAEERAAFAVRAPDAFAVLETVAAGTV